MKKKIKIAIYSRKSKYSDKGNSCGNQIELAMEYINLHYPESEYDREIVIYEDEGFETGYIKDGVLQTKKFGFSKTIEVEEGKEVKTIKVGPFINPTNASDQYTFPMIYVKPLE